MAPEATDPVLERPQPTLLLPVLHDIRNRQDPAYLDDFHNRFVPDVAERGIQVPLICHREGQRLRVIDGETRRLAALMAGNVETLPVLVYEEKPDEAALKLAQLLANSLRRDNTPLELAAVYQDLIRLNGWSQAMLAKRVHVSPAHVAKVLAISSKLCPDVRELVATGKLAPRAAYALSRLSEAQQTELLSRKGMPIDEMAVESVEEHVGKLLGKKQPRAKAVKARADGVTLVAPGDWTWEKVKELAERLKGAAARGEKMDAPFSLLPSLLKGV